MLTKQEARQVAEIILSQLGGRMAKAMIGMHNIIFLQSSDCGGVQFSFKGSRSMNKCMIELTATDEYNMRLYQFRPTSGKCPMRKEIKGLYCEDLIPVFESETGLYLSL